LRALDYNGKEIPADYWLGKEAKDIVDVTFRRADVLRVWPEPGSDQEAAPDSDAPADISVPNETPGAALVLTMQAREITEILKELGPGPMPEKRAWPAVKAKAEASGKRVTRYQVRCSLATLGWKLPRGRPKSLRA
jgi:hypothetical protein